MKMEAPLRVGFRFRPTDEEIILGYLLNKVNNQPLPSNGVVECDLYGDETIWQDVFQGTGEESLYFFTNLKITSDGGSRIDRGTTCGSWQGQMYEEIFYHQKVIGSKKIFAYAAKRGLTGECRWTMTEYRLDGSLFKNAKENNYVLCRIKKLKNRAMSLKESGSTSIRRNNAITAESNLVADVMSSLQIQELSTSNSEESEL